MHEPGSLWPYAYLLLSVGLFVVWVLLYGLRPDVRRQMLRVSLATMPLGLTEPLFVPSYWNPPTLLDLAHRTGFDLESLLFSFAIGGIVFAAYGAIFRTTPTAGMTAERHDPRHRYHLAAVAAGPGVFLLGLTVTTLNPIYVAAIALVAGFGATIYCRRDLWAKMLVSGVLFLGVYFVVFAAFNLAFSGYVAAVWNLAALSGVLLAGVPLEELMFAFTFGLYWSSVYEHLTWQRSRPVANALSVPARIGSVR